jgi:endoglucanase
VVQEKTCDKDGITKYTCKECKDSYEETAKATGHDYRSRVVSEKTCTVDGEVKYTCRVCDHSYTEIDEASGHTKGNPTIVSEPSGSNPGIKRYNCTKCGALIKEEKYYNTPYQQNGKLSVNGRDLVNQNGEKFQLYGLSTHGLQWFSKVVNEGTLTAIRNNFGNNIFRFALYTDEDGYCDGSEAVKKRMLETLEKGIEIATDLGLYVIVDWHMVGAENVLDKNPLTYLEEAKEFFSYISNKYKDQDNILYEIMNEPNGSTTWADCKKYANEVIPCIRKNTDAIILVGNPKWTADLNSVMKDPLTGYKNIMYTYHFYAADHSNTSQVVKAYDSGFPVFISEFGFMESSGDGAISPTNGNKWKQVLDSRNISYVAWNISNSKGSASIFKYNTSNLSDVSDSNLKEWGVYLKNWYSSKSQSSNDDNNSNNNNDNSYDQTITKVDFDFTVELTSDEWTNNGAPYWACFIATSGYSDSRLNYDWSSSNDGILSINEYSTITINSDGKCSIICRTKTGDKVAVVDVETKNGQIVNSTSRYNG